MGSAFPRMDASIEELQDEIARLREEGARLREEDARLRGRVRQLEDFAGRLAGGVSHDFNNLLTAVMMHAELAMEDLGESSPVRQDLELIYGAAARGVALTRQLLAFARKQVITPRLVDLNDLLLRQEALLRRLLGAHIELVSMPAPDLGMVRVDPAQIEQVLVNLAMNAREAMPGGGTLTLATESRVLHAGDASAHPGLAPGAYVVLRVADTGPGMSEETMAHVFEPFFTTREAGKGMGLALATCHGIVKQSGGDIRVHSAPGRGSVFEVLLPRAEAPGAEASQPDAPADPATAVPAAGKE